MVYSKQIGAEENNGKAPRGPDALLSPPWGQEQHSPSDAPVLRAALGQVGPGFGDRIGSEIGGHPPTRTPQLAPKERRPCSWGNSECWAKGPSITAEHNSSHLKKGQNGFEQIQFHRVESGLRTQAPSEDRVFNCSQEEERIPGMEAADLLCDSGWGT